MAICPVIQWLYKSKFYEHLLQVSKDCIWSAKTGKGVGNMLRDSWSVLSLHNWAPLHRQLLQYIVQGGCRKVNKGGEECIHGGTQQLRLDGLDNSKTIERKVEWNAFKRCLSILHNEQYWTRKELQRNQNDNKSCQVFLSHCQFRSMASDSKHEKTTAKSHQIWSNAVRSCNC